MPAIRDENGLFAGTMIGKYKIERALGAGGFGITYRAEDPVTGKLWAIKEFYPRQFHTAEGLKLPTAGTEEAMDFEFARDKFLEEAKHLLAFNHPNIVGVHDPPIEVNGTWYIIMDFVEGKSLEQRLQAMGRPMTEAELRPIFDKVLDAVAYLHDHNYMHRDLSPDNIMLRPDDTPVLIDFGTLGVELDRRGTTLQFRRDEYSPPEQGLVGTAQGAYSDIYALGGALYRTLTGFPPAAALDRSSSVARQKPDSYVPVASQLPSKSTASRELLAAIDSALRLNENDRPQTIENWRSLLGWVQTSETNTIPDDRSPQHRSRTLDEARVRSKPRALSTIFTVLSLITVVAFAFVLGTKIAAFLISNNDTEKAVSKKPKNIVPRNTRIPPVDVVPTVKGPASVKTKPKKSTNTASIVSRRRKQIYDRILGDNTPESGKLVPIRQKPPVYFSPTIQASPPSQVDPLPLPLPPLPPVRHGGPR